MGCSKEKMWKELARSSEALEGKLEEELELGSEQGVELQRLEEQRPMQRPVVEDGAWRGHRLAVGWLRFLQGDLASCSAVVVEGQSCGGSGSSSSVLEIGC